MRFLERLEEAFPGKGQLIVDVIRYETAPQTYATVADLLGTRYCRPNPVELQMLAINEILGGYGVEAIFRDGGRISPDMEYVNMGDPYNATVVYDYIDGKFIVTAWGDWIEHAEKQGRTYS